MAIAAKPNKKPKSINTIDDAKALDFISQGGTVPAKSNLDEEPSNISAKGRHTTKTDPNERVHVSVRLLVSERNRINTLRVQRSGRSKISLESWVIEAVNEKLMREEKTRNQV